MQLFTLILYFLFNFLVVWSPKGTQLALGMQGGDVTYSPTQTSTLKSSILHPASANGMSVISLRWLSASSFHTIYAPPGQLASDTEQLHFHVPLDSKMNSAQDIKFNNPYLPFPGLRPPGSFLVTLKNWDPYKTLFFLADSTSSDIGAIGAVTDGASDSWHNLSLEETSMPSLPLDKDQNDTVMIGLDLDLTNSGSYHHTTASGELQELSSPPIMYAYASDGMVVGWYLLNTGGMSTMVWSRDQPCLWGSKPQALSHESHLRTCIRLYRFHRRRLQT